MSRPTSKIGKAGAEAHTTVPIVKTVIVPKNNCLVVNHCNKTAEIGMTIAITSINPVAIHCTAGNEISNSFIKVVSAILSHVSLKIAKKTPIMKESIIGKTYVFRYSAQKSYFVASYRAAIIALFISSRSKRVGEGKVEDVVVPKSMTASC